MIGSKLICPLVDRTCVDTDQKISHRFLTHTKIAIAALVVLAASIFIMATSISFADTAPAPEGSGQISADVAAKQVYVEKERDDLAVLDLDIASAEQYLDQNRMKLADANDRLSDAENEYDQTLKMFEGRLAEIYKLGGYDAYSVLLSSDSFSEAVSRVNYLATISENDRNLVDRVRAEAEQVQTIHQQVDELKQAQAVDVKGMEERRAELQNRIDIGVKDINAENAQLALAQAREQQAAALMASAGPPAGLDVSGSDPATVGVAPPSGLSPTGVSLSGVASWYGPGFDGQTTADGERYNMYAFTAANKTLPFGTWLKVTYGNRSVFVRINDRGPYVGDRFLDLSYASAQALGLTGIGYVTAEIYR